MKRTTMKRAWTLFWHGLTGILTGIINGIATILGMNDNSRYGKFVRRVTGGCFAFIMLVIAVAMGWDFCRTASNRLGWDSDEDDTYIEAQVLSRNATYYCDMYNDGKSYVENREGKKTISGICWIAKPLGFDSLICYSNGKRRGYFNQFTGETVIKPKYRHAWIFSEGLAAVDDEGWIKFIDKTGEVIIDPRIPYLPGSDGYVFHNSHCAIHGNRRDRLGLIDKEGNWVLQPDYFSITPQDTFWIVNNGKEKSVITDRLQTVVPFIAGNIWILDDCISVTMDDHSIRRYNFQGELIEDFFISSIEYLTYETPELHYTTTQTYDDEGNLVSETSNSEPSHIRATAKCKRYEAESGWYGLMTPEGKILTPPAYSDITAVGYDMYLCKENAEDGILLNSKGEKFN